MDAVEANDASDAARRTVDALKRREQGALDDLEKMVIAERPPEEIQAQAAKVQALHRELVDARVEAREAETVADREQAQANRAARDLEAAEDGRPRLVAEQSSWQPGHPPRGPAGLEVLDLEARHRVVASCAAGEPVGRPEHAPHLHGDARPLASRTTEVRSPYVRAAVGRTSSGPARPSRRRTATSAACTGMARSERPRRWSSSSRPAATPSATASAASGSRPAVVEAARQDEQVAGEPVAADVGALPHRVGMRTRGERRRQRSAALGAAGVVPAVGADGEQRGRRTPPARSSGQHRGRPGRRRGRRRRCRGVAASSHESAPAARAAKTRVPAPSSRRPWRRTSSTRTRCRRPCSARCAPSPSGRRASRRASAPHGPACSSRRKLRTVEAVPARSSPRSSLAAAHRKP